jgi:PAS domain-containing protein
MHTNTDVTNNDPHFRNLVDNALTGIIDNTFEGKILFVNQALARMLEPVIDILLGCNPPKDAFRTVGEVKGVGGAVTRPAK